MKKYVLLNKAVGETPLQAVEKWRATASPAYANLPLAYAGRLDPMASGQLLVLIGEECKRQEHYHRLDKAYNFSILLGVKTDSADVLGLITKTETTPVDLKKLPQVLKTLRGSIELPYPHFSARPVGGKPLHTWTLENRLDEISIPTKLSTIYRLKLLGSETLTGHSIYETVRQKIETIAEVTDPRKALGNDFRRPQVRASWNDFKQQHSRDVFTILHLTCTASSGTYMRTLAEVIAGRLGTVGLAYAIERTAIGHYQKLPFFGGFWRQRF